VQHFEFFNQRHIVSRTLAAVSLNELENHAQSVKQVEEAGNHSATGGHLAIAQQSKEVFAAVSKLLKTFETEEPRGSFDSVYGAKDLAQQRSVLRPRLKIGKAPLHAVQAFLTLDKELSSQLVHGHSLIRSGPYLFLKTAGAR
jgi:hypothetical protein